MTHSLARSLVLAGASGLFLPLSFPKSDLGLLAWIALVPLHWALDGKTKTQAFWIGWLSGTIAFTGMMAWVVTAMNTYGKVPLVISYGLMLLLTAYLGLYVGLYSAGAVWFRTLIPRYGLFAVPCLWVTLELIRTYVLSGLPWGLLGYSQYRQIEMIQIADHMGVYGVSFLIVLVNVALAEFLSWLMPLLRGFRPAKLPWELVAMTALLVTLSWEYGLGTLSGAPFSDIPRSSISVGVVQPNVDQAVKWDTAYREETLARFDRLTEQLGRATDLVIWPEAATPFVFEREPIYQLQLIALANRAQAPILFGSPALRFYPDRRPYLLNSAYLLSPDGQLLGRYDKQHLVPFGEYIPFKSSFLFFLDKLVEGIGDFEAGPGPTISDLDAEAPVCGCRHGGDDAATGKIRGGNLLRSDLSEPGAAIRREWSGVLGDRDERCLVWSLVGGLATFFDGGVSFGRESFGLCSLSQHRHFRVHRSVRAHRRGDADLHGAGRQGDDAGLAPGYVLQPARRCVCLRLCYNLRAFVPVRLFPHQGI